MEKVREFNRSREKLLLLVSFLEKDHLDRIFELIKLCATLSDEKIMNLINNRNPNNFLT